MNGTIIFPSAEELGLFLKAFTGSTALFEVIHDNRGYVLTFNGGY